MTITISLLSFMGLLISLYAVHVESRASSDSTFVATCDIAGWMSCSKVFTSKYGHMFSALNIVPKGHVFDIPNALFGCFFYAALLILRPIAMRILPGAFVRYSLFLAISTSVLANIWLGWILITILHEFCPVCASTYIINMGMLYLAFQDIRKPSSTNGKMKTR